MNKEELELLGLTEMPKPIEVILDDNLNNTEERLTLFSDMHTSKGLGLDDSLENVKKLVVLIRQMEKEAKKNGESSFLPNC